MTQRKNHALVNALWPSRRSLLPFTNHEGRCPVTSECTSHRRRLNLMHLSCSIFKFEWSFWTINVEERFWLKKSIMTPGYNSATQCNFLTPKWSWASNNFITKHNLPDSQCSSHPHQAKWKTISTNDRNMPTNQIKCMSGPCQVNLRNWLRFPIAIWKIRVGVIYFPIRKYKKESASSDAAVRISRPFIRRWARR